MPLLIDTEDAKIQMTVHFLINIAINNHFDLNFGDICLAGTLQISGKSLNILQRFQKLMSQNGQNLACKILIVQLRNSIRISIHFHQLLLHCSQYLTYFMHYTKWKEF